MAENGKVQEITSKYLANNLDRRTALSQLLHTGLSARAAYIALGVTLPAASSYSQSTDAQDLAELVRKLNEVVAKPDITAALQGMKGLPPSAKAAAARDVVGKISDYKKADETLSSLRASLRIFETDQKTGVDSTILQGAAAGDKFVTFSKSDAPMALNDRFKKIGETAPPPNLAGTVCASLGMVACVSYGVQR